MAMRAALRTALLILPLSSLILVGRVCPQNDKEVRQEAENQVADILKSSFGGRAGQVDPKGSLSYEGWASKIKNPTQKAGVIAELSGLELEFSDPAALKVLAKAYADLGAWDRAKSVNDALKAKNPKDPETFLLDARALREAGKPDEARQAAQKAMALAQAQGDTAVLGQAQTLLKLTGGGGAALPATPPSPKPAQARFQGAAVPDPKLDEAARALASGSQTGRDILKQDFAVDQPQAVRTLQQLLPADKFVVRTDKTGRLKDSGVEVTKGTGADAGKTVLTFDLKTLDENQSKTLAPLLGGALREGALTRDSEGKPFYSQVLTKLDGTVKKIWIAVEVRGQEGKFEDTTLGKGLNFLVRVWEDDLRNRPLQDSELQSYPQMADAHFKTLMREEVLHNQRGAGALLLYVSQKTSDEASVTALPTYQNEITQTQQQLQAADNSYRTRHSMPRLAGQ